MPDIENIVTEFTRRTYFLDELDKATYAYNVEQTINSVKEVGFLDTMALWELQHLGIRFIYQFARNKGITNEEAIDLITEQKVLYDDFIDILNCIIKPQ